MKRKFARKMSLGAGALVAMEIVLGLSLSTLARAEVRADEVLGRYWLPNRVGQVELYRQDQRYYGRVVAFESPDARDKNNRDPNLRERPIIGMDMFSDFHFAPSNSRWVNGTVYDGGSGRTYSCSLWFEGANRDVLWARGFIGISIFGRTERFERVRAAP